MSTPNPTTTIRIERPPDADDGAEPRDPWEDNGAPQLVVAAAGIPAHIGLEKGTPNREGANTPDQYFALSADPCPLHKDDFVVDETTLHRYRVDWTFARVSSSAPMLERMRARISRVDGAVADAAPAIPLPGVFLTDGFGNVLVDDAGNPLTPII